MLTSAEGLAILTEKEEKKKQEKEEKEKRKKERLDKRREKQELSKKKAEEKASKSRNKGKKSTTQKQRKQQNNPSVRSSEQASTSEDTTVAETLNEETSGETLPGCESSHSGVMAIPGPSDLDLDYQCSKCFGMYKEDIDLGNGAEWVQCGCGQWIHEDCIDKSVTGEDRKERMCCNCVV